MILPDDKDPKVGYQLFLCSYQNQKIISLIMMCSVQQYAESCDFNVVGYICYVLVKNVGFFLCRLFGTKKKIDGSTQMRIRTMQTKTPGQPRPQRILKLLRSYPPHSCPRQANLQQISLRVRRFEVLIICFRSASSEHLQCLCCCWICSDVDLKPRFLNSEMQFRIIECSWVSSLG